MEKTNTKYTYLKAFIAGFFIYLVGILPILFLTGGINMYAGDYNVQMIPFWKHIANNYQNEIPYFDWKTDLGLNYIGSYSFYGLTSPFTLILSLFPMRIIPYALNFVNAAKFGLAALGASIYCNRYLNKDKSVFICGILYAFSEIQLYCMVTHFADSIALFPFLLFSIDELIYNRRSGLFAFCTALCAFTNYFFFWAEFVFIFIYFVVKVCTKEYKINIKLFVKLVFESVIGTLMSFVILLPTLFTILNNSRASKQIFNVNLLSYEESGTLWRVFSSIFFIPDFCRMGVIFSNEQLDLAGVSLYIPLFFFIGVIYIIRKERKKWYSLLVGICAVFASIPLLNSIFVMFNQNYYARWFFMPILVMIMMTGKLIDEFESADIRKELKVTAICMGLFVIYGIYILTVRNSIKSQVLKTYFISSMILSVISLAMIYSIRYTKKNGRINISHLPVISMCFSCAGVILCSVMVITSNNYSMVSDYLEQEYNEGTPVDINDNEFFRTSTEENNFSNTTMNWGYPTIDAFHSMISGKETEFYSLVGLYRESNGLLTQEDYPINSFLSVKYDLYYNALLAGGVEVEPEDVAFNKVGFEMKDVQNRYIIYENTAFIPMGFTYDYYLNVNEFTPLLVNDADTDVSVAFGNLSEDTDDKNLIDKERNEKLLLKAIWLDDEQIAKYSNILTALPDDLKNDTSDKTYFVDCEKRRKNASSSFVPNNNGFSSKIHLNRDNLVFYSVPYDDGFTAYVDGEEVDIEKVFGGLSAIYVASGDHTIEFIYTVKGLRTGVIISLVSLGVFIAYIVLNFHRNYKIIS